MNNLGDFLCFAGPLLLPGAVFLKTCVEEGKEEAQAVCKKHLGALCCIEILPLWCSRLGFCPISGGEMHKSIGFIFAFFVFEQFLALRPHPAWVASSFFVPDNGALQNGMPPVAAA